MKWTLGDVIVSFWATLTSIHPKSHEILSLAFAKSSFKRTKLCLDWVVQSNMIEARVHFSKMCPVSKKGVQGLDELPPHEYFEIYVDGHQHICFLLCSITWWTLN